MEAAETREHAPRADDVVEVAWLGTRPAWLDMSLASTFPDAFEVGSAITETTKVIHLARETSESVVAVRAARPAAALVVDVGHLTSKTRNVLRELEVADMVLVESEAEAVRARARVPALDGRVAVAPAPLDLEWHAPESTLLRTAGMQIKRFRRLHRLAHPTVLFVGPYTPAGGLDVAISAAYHLRDDFEDLRLAAVPLGAVEQKYLDRCEMDALALGHRGIVEWTSSAETLRFWYATATVVCCPWLDACESAEVPVLAAAAARPFIASDLAVFRTSFRAPDAPAHVLPGSLAELVGALKPLLANVAKANEHGASARSAVEDVFSYQAAARRLTSLWSSVAKRPLLGEVT